VHHDTSASAILPSCAAAELVQKTASVDCQRLRLGLELPSGFRARINTRFLVEASYRDRAVRHPQGARTQFAAIFSRLPTTSPYVDGMPYSTPAATVPVNRPNDMVCRDTERCHIGVS